ncbi:hypothetical protein [Parvibaculum sp.]|uniref:hypothetical protein n=1 Tax=Parvibaculum sp. TaxID=2024848 RepID=UPI001D8C7A15|nr:hypothetical protein [Parvibaculum sp.]MBX3488889.1 hypothetical protein [Parvibaculum sp.]MCW5727229.1 hypothetical protein [Parvibaculum sp.]
MGTKNNPGAFDCYAAAEPDEPIFVLLGRDRHAPSLVRLWALARMREGEDEAKVQEALQCAAAMDAHLIERGIMPAKAGAIFEPALIALTTPLDEHPEDYDWPCNCADCRSYD